MRTKNITVVGPLSAQNPGAMPTRTPAAKGWQRGEEALLLTQYIWLEQQQIISFSPHPATANMASKPNKISPSF